MCRCCVVLLFDVSFAPVFCEWLCDFVDAVIQRGVVSEMVALLSAEWIVRVWYWTWSLRGMYL